MTPRARWSLATLAWSVWPASILDLVYRGDAFTVVHAARVTLPWYAVQIAACAGVVLVASLLGRRAWLVLFALPPVLLLAIAAGAKRRFLGEPPRWRDLSLLREAWSVVSVHDLLSAPSCALLVLVLAAAWPLARALPITAPSTRDGQIAAGMGAVALWCACALGAPWLLARSARQPEWRTLGGGLVADVAARFDAGRRERMASLEAEVTRARSLSSATERAPARPHVVVVLSESFWDLTLLPNVRFDRDPLPTYHALRSRFPSGMMLSPQFGGGTANVELEVLTGMPMRFLPEGTLAYAELLRRDVDSMASTLRRAGWTATAISPWPSWYAGARDAYQHLGFDRFVSGEFLPADVKGKYLADDAIADEILARLAEGDGPQLVFANTAENHFPFPPHKFATNTVHVAGLEDGLNAVLESYAEGVKDADAMLAKLVTGIRALGAPTVLVWFGDHLPALPVRSAASMSRGGVLAIYEAAGWIHGDADPAFLERMHRTPALVWDNFLPESHDTLSFSACYLGAYALKRAKLPMSPFMAFLTEERETVPLLPPVWSSVALPPAPLASLRTLERDALLGDGRINEGVAESIASPNFELGLGPLTLIQATRLTIDGSQWTVALDATNAPPRTRVYAGVERLKSEWNDRGHLTAHLDARSHPLGAKVALQLVVPSLVATAPPEEGSEVVMRSRMLDVMLVPTSP